MIYNDCVRVRWMKHLEDLVTKYNFGEFLCQRNKGDFTEWYHENYEVDDAGFEFYHGETRLVIVDEKKDFVLKIDFADSERGYIYNYNRIEATVYEAAVKAGLEQHFAAMEKFADYEFTYGTGLFVCPIYIMEYCDSDEDENTSRSTEFQYERYCSNHGLDEDSDETRSTFNRHHCSLLDGDEDAMSELAESLWGGDLSDLFQFLDECHVYDLHSGNWGFIGDRFVICDYASYRCTVMGIPYRIYIDDIDDDEDEEE